MSNPAPTSPAPPPVPETVQGLERFIVWIGSPTSLVLHTIVFIASFAVSIAHLVAWELMLLVLTTAVSLEAIYLAIFIQMSVNRQTASLKEVEEDVGDIHQEIEELGENVEDLKEDVEDIQEDIGEDDDDDEARTSKQAVVLDALTNDVKAILNYLESMKTR